MAKAPFFPSSILYLPSSPPSSHCPDMSICGPLSEAHEDDYSCKLFELNAKSAGAPFP